MRKGTKSSLYTSFSPITEDVKPEGSQYVVVDGGHLLHKFVWRQQATFGAIADRYVQYLKNKYGQDIAVIFDGYPDDDKKSTKNCERLRRAAHSSPDVLFHEGTVLQSTQENLLANECNKKRFIELLEKAFQKANICVQQAVEDADLTIVNTAISVAPQYDYVRVSCENPMPVILNNESEEGNAPAPIDMVDEQLECEDIELQSVNVGAVLSSGWLVI
ncbi:hypothetical protein AVEN_61967-1 [Araneus ventricosus]|uniref:Uncharacterized protein n=1 Tax=Araneus ventricosus TaxID=182803 RepID=A0A4Y2P4D2_ARAVE|nr:hypothetical protein AVEN_61967-1 [Araneus ventricosus]